MSEAVPCWPAIAALMTGMERAQDCIVWLRNRCHVLSQKPHLMDDTTPHDFIVAFHAQLHALPIKHLLFHMAGNKPAQHVRAGRCSELSGISLGNLCHRRMINDDPVGIMTPLPMFRHDEKQRSQDEEMQQRFPQQPRAPTPRSEERRVGKEWVSTCRSRWSQYH